MAPTALRRRAVVDLGELRSAGAVMLGAGMALRVLPDHAGLPCPLRVLTGAPCPLCGTTSSVTATLSGDVERALATNPAGVAAVVVAVALLLAPARRASLPLVYVLVALGGLWLFQLHRFGFV